MDNTGISKDLVRSSNFMMVDGGKDSTYGELIKVRNFVSYCKLLEEGIGN
jgi:hypothetical protein